MTIEDLTHARSAPVLVIYVKFKDKILLVKRSDKVLTYKNLWSCLAGFVDDEKSMEEKVKFEIKEEIGLDEKDIISITEGETYLFTDEKLNREWVRHLFLVKISNPTVKLTWEHMEYVWVTLDDVFKYETTPGFEEDLKKAMDMTPKVKKGTE